jgi:acetolactate synthase I/II/III large subunit
MSSTGAEIILEYLIRQKIPYLFGVCGHGVLGFLDAAYDRQDEITTVTTHDESVAGFMADAYFRVTGEPVATYTSCGPGSVNLVLALASAFQDSSAFLAITGNVPTQHFNRGPFQETGRFFQGDFSSVVRPYVKRSYQAFRAEMLPQTVRQAHALMLTGRPGPVHLDVPLNVFVEETDLEVPDADTWKGAVSARPGADPEMVGRAADLLLAAKRPVIAAGNGVLLSRAGAELTALAEAMSIPVITTPLAKGAIDERHHLSLGPTGRNGTLAANRAARNSDVLLAVGTRFDDRSTSGWIPGVTYEIPPTRLIHVDIDPQEIGRNYPPELGITADARVFFRQLLDAVSGRQTEEATERASWVKETQSWVSEFDSDIALRQRDDAVPLRPDRVVGELQAALPEDSILLADVGLHHNWLLQQIKSPSKGRFLQAWGFAAMGFGVGGALGAKYAAPDQPVVAVCGDGGFVMHASAVATAVMNDLPVVWLVWNNSGYGAIYGQQRGFFGADRELATRFHHPGSVEPYTPDMAAMAVAMGAQGLSVEKPTEVSDAVAEAIRSGKPTVIDVVVDDLNYSAPATGAWDLPPLESSPPNYGWEGDPDAPMTGSRT